MYTCALAVSHLSTPSPRDDAEQRHTTSNHGNSCRLGERGSTFPG